MTRRLRFIPEGGALVEVTCRTVQGRFLLRPTKDLCNLVIGVLARAQRKYSVDLHAFVFLSNHFHLLLTAENAEQLARFMNYVNSNVAREAGRLTEWREKFWGRRYQAIVISEEESAQVNRLRYVLSHGCKEGLIASPYEWPGPSTVRALIEGETLQGLWFDRTREYKARLRHQSLDKSNFSSIETVRLEPLPCWRGLPEQLRRRTVAELIRQIEDETAARHSAEGTRPVGVRAVLAQRPHDRPPELKSGSAPLFHAVSTEVRRELVDAYRLFVESFRKAARKLREGNQRVRFPKGSFPSRLPFVAEGVDWAPG